LTAAIMREPLADPVDEALELLGEADSRGIVLRALGGVAVRLIAPAARRPPLERRVKDIDVAGHSQDRDAIAALLTDFGYVPDAEFNLYQGATRLLFYDTANGRQLDVFLDQLVMCHTLPLRDRLGEADRTLTAADLLLSKLQVVELNERDLQDAAALLADCEIDDDRLASVLAADWGWWRTCTENLGRVADYADGIGLPAVRGRVAELSRAIEAAPKNFKWRARARVGERAQWYRLPEEHE
jgi:hypothetical protein